MRTFSAALLIVVGAFNAGCASAPRLPAELDLRRAAIAADAAETAVALDGHAGKGSAAASGAAMGGGTGLLIGGLSCIAAGPLAPLCLAVVVPTTTAVGAASGAVIGAVRAESAELVEAKRSLLQAGLTSAAAPTRLAAQVQQALRESRALELPLAAADAGAAAAAAWRLNVALTELATVGSGADAPFALRASARLELVRVQDAQAVFVKDYQALGAPRATTAQWRVDDSALLQVTLDSLLTTLAAQMATDLTAADAGKAAVPATKPALAASAQAPG